jgi:UDP-glucose 4-epimerase
MKAIVFGGSGFLGSHVADALTRAGHETVIFDIKKSPHLQKGQEMVVGNILDRKAVGAAVKGCDVVYNFAGMADIQEAYHKPVETVESNVLGNTIILEASRLNQVKRFVFASTLYVYSAAGAFYRSSKYACELIIADYNEVFGLPYTILRYSSLYGPRAGETNWVRQILKQALEEKKITRYGNGEEIREYIHVEDAARCSLKILDKAYENQCVIIAGQQPMKVKDLLVMIREMLSNKIELEFLPTDSSLHYEITPYTFSPRVARRVISDSYLDLGQGLLQCLEEIYRESHQEK